MSSKISRVGLSTILGAGLYASVAASPAYAATYFSIEASTAAQTITIPSAINSTGAVVGSLEHPDYSFSGFTRAPDGTITLYDATGATSTTFAGIDNMGNIGGGYKATPPAASHNFILAPDGTLKTLMAGAGISAMNGIGDIAGGFVDGSQVTHGMFRKKGGTIVKFDPPGSTQTFPAAINHNDQIAGNFTDSSSKTHGFLRDSSGTITVFDVPGSILTYARGINYAGDIVGMYGDSTGLYHGYLRYPNGAFKSFDPPDMLPSGEGTYAMAINDSNAITGQYMGTDRHYHGFVRAKNGTITEFDEPQTGTFFTFPTEIDNAGNIVGQYYYKVGSRTYRYGFLRTP